MTYRSIASSETDPNAPITAALMKALDGNPTAIANGDTGAPRVKGKSLGAVYKSTVEFDAASWASVTGLDDVGTVGLSGFLSLNVNASVSVQYSNNGGSSWGSTQSITGLSSGNPSANLPVFIRLNLQTGVTSAISAQVSATENQVYSGTHTVPADCNAFRILVSSVAGVGQKCRCIVDVLSGIE